MHRQESQEEADSILLFSEKSATSTLAARLLREGQNSFVGV
jgi:hypothetical protein